jgi:hypothetical protein
MRSSGALADIGKGENSTLGDLLCNAASAMADLQAQAERICSSGRAEELEFSHRHLEGLCSFLGRGLAEIRKRMPEDDAILGLDSGGRGFELRAQDLPSEPVELLSAYRASCRCLCKAMRQSVLGSNRQLTSILSELIVNLEKQLWVIDAPSRNYGAYEVRSVALFRSC